MTKERFLEIVTQIMDDMPLSLENDADGRYTWPRRWKELRKRIEYEFDSDTRLEELYKRIDDLQELA